MAGKYTGLTNRPDRSAGIAGKLKRPTPRAAKDTTEAELPSVSAPQEPRESSLAPTSTTPEPADGDVRPGTVVTTVTVDAQAYEWVHEQAIRRGGIPQTQVVLEAIERAYETLAAKAIPAATPSRRLFGATTTSAPRRSGRRRDGRPRRQVFLRMTEQDVEVLDSLASELAMGNRSNLAEQAIHEVMRQDKEKE